MIAFRRTGSIFGSDTGTLAPLAPSMPSRVPWRASKTLARAGPCTSRPSRLHEYQKKGPATAVPTAYAPTNTMMQAAAICSPRLMRDPCVPPLPSPMGRRVNAAAAPWLRPQRLKSRASKPRFGGAEGGEGVSRGRSSSSGGSIDRGTAPRSRWARIAAFISSRCDSSSVTRSMVRRGAAVGLVRCGAMCFELDSEPPIPRISGAAVSHDDLVLESEDGNRFAAFRAVPEAGSVTGQAGDAQLEDRGAEGAAGGEISTGVVILPDVRGLYRFYEELALRFAERGHAAIAFDYFGRTAGVDKRPDDWDYMPLVQQLTHEQVQADVAACVRDLRALGCDAVFTVGFCFGGSGSWAAAAWGHGLAGAVGFYGRPGRMIDLVPKLDAPILALQGGADQGIPHEDNVAFEQALRDAGKAYELIEFEGAPHSFFDRKQEEFQAASDAAWRRTLDFIATYS